MSKKNKNMNVENVETIEKVEAEVVDIEEEIVEVKESKMDKVKGFFGKHKGKFAFAGALTLGLVGGLMLGRRINDDEDDESEDVAGYIDYSDVEDDLEYNDEFIEKLTEETIVEEN